MPIFNLATESPPSNQGGFFDITDPEFLATLNGSEWVSAETALKNSDLFSIISQLSNDLATAKLTTSRKQMQGIVDNPTFTSLSLLKCYWVVKPLHIDGVMTTGVI